MTLSAILALLQAVLTLLLAVQSNPALPPSVTSSVTQLAQQVITEVSQDLPSALQNSSVTSASAHPIQTTPSVTVPSESVVLSPPASSVNAPPSSAPTLPWLHFCPVVVPFKCSTQAAPVYDDYGCVTAYICAAPTVVKLTPPPAETTNPTSPPVTNSSCVVHTAYCGNITVPNGSNAEDTHLCGAVCLMQHCDNGVMETGSTASAGYVNLSCAAEPYSL